MHPAALRLTTATAGAGEDHPLNEMRDHLAAGLHNAYHAETPEAAATHLETAAGDLPSVDHETHGAGEEAWEHLRGALSTFHDDLAFIRRHAERLVTSTSPSSRRPSAVQVAPIPSIRSGISWSKLIS